MQWTALRALVRKDLLLFVGDRRAVIMGFIAPIAIASFFGSIFSGQGDSEPATIPIAIVNEDTGAVASGIVAGAQKDRTLKVTTPTRDEARASVRAGRVTVAVVIPPGFGDAAGQAFVARSTAPTLTMWFDPSHAAEVGMVRGIMTQHVMEAVTRAVFGSDSAFRLPYTVAEEAVTSTARVPYNGYAHSFAGMGAQFMLFAAIDLGIGILLERQRGLWKRLRSAPLSRLWLLGGKTLSGAIIGLATMLVSFAFAIVVFKVRIAGSLGGFVVICAAYAVMASTFGLLIAALGRTPGGTRGVAILASLLMVMLGGAWVPAFVFPAWLQRVTLVIPVRWAVDGLDAMTWRGLGMGAAIMPTVVLLGFSILFGSLALARFRWEEA